MENHNYFMQRAIELSKQSVEEGGGSSFGFIRPSVIRIPY